MAVDTRESSVLSHSTRAGFHADVVAGLSARHKQVPCKYFYDETGSNLFERICAQPEYYLTRAELALMHEHAAAMAELIGPGCQLIEYGSGSSVKTQRLLDRLHAPVAYVPIDISSVPLHASALALAQRYPALQILPLCADFTEPLEVPASTLPARRRVVYFPGSTIGNLTPSASILLLRRTAELCGPGGALLLGADLKKDPNILHAAYNDAAGVTAAFNLNLLARINRELDADFDLGQFCHYALYNPDRGRIEMHLVSRRQQRVRVGTRSFTFADGESIRTEYSHKFNLHDLQRQAAAGGFKLRRVWHDPARTFCVLYLVTA
jgi:dimethylhistidine N-methyltransferase